MIAGPVAAGSSYASTNSVLLPNFADGTYYLVLTIDFANSVNQFTRANDVLAVPITLGTSVIPTPTAIILGRASILAGGAFQFSFSNTPGVSFTVLATTDPPVPTTGWTQVGKVTEASTGQFQFTDLQNSGNRTRFYRVRSP